MAKIYCRNNFFKKTSLLGVQTTRKQSSAWNKGSWRIGPYSVSGWSFTGKRKHRKNCECCPVSLLIVRNQRLSWIQVLNCQNSNQCLNCQKSKVKSSKKVPRKFLKNSSKNSEKLPKKVPKKFQTSSKKVPKKFQKVQSCQKLSQDQMSQSSHVSRVVLLLCF